MTGDVVGVVVMGAGAGIDVGGKLELVTGGIGFCPC